MVGQAWARAIIMLLNQGVAINMGVGLSWPQYTYSVEWNLSRGEKGQLKCDSLATVVLAVRLSFIAVAGPPSSR